MKIEFVDLKRQLYGDPVLGTAGIIDEVMEEVRACLKGTAFTMGSYLERFEKEFADYCGARYCVGLNSGTDALEFALRCKGLTEGEVITAPNSYFSSASSISQAGLTPRFVDVDPNNLNLDPEKLEKAINSRTRAILPVHLYGRPADMHKIRKIAQIHNLVVVEDCCQAHGARYSGVRVPTEKLGAFSFFPGKNLGCWGDGGALVTNDEEVARQAQLWRNDGAIKKYYHEIVGRKARLHSIQAAILHAKLKHLDDWNAARREHASKYHELLEGIKELQLPLLGDRVYEPVFHLYPVFTLHRIELQEYLEKKEISVVRHYPTPIHLQPAYASLGYKKGDFPVAEKLAENTLSIPLFPEMRDDEIAYVADAITSFFKNFS